MKQEELSKNKKDLEKKAIKRIKTGLILNEFGEQNKINVSEQEMQTEIQKQLRMMPGQEKMLQEYYQKNPAVLDNLRGKGLTTGSFHEEKQEETEEETDADGSLITTANEFLGEKPRYGWDKTDENFCETIFNIAKAVKGLGCKDFFFLQPLSVDHGLVNSYMDHLITIENLIKIFKETGDTKNKKQGAEEIFLRLRTVMMEIREKIIDPIQKDVNGKNLKTFTEYVDKWNSTINDVLEVDKAWGNQYEYGKPLKVDLPAVEEKSK